MHWTDRLAIAASVASPNRYMPFEDNHTKKKNDIDEINENNWNCNINLDSNNCRIAIIYKT